MICILLGMLAEQKCVLFVHTTGKLMTFWPKRMNFCLDDEKIRCQRYQWLWLITENTHTVNSTILVRTNY